MCIRDSWHTARSSGVGRLIYIDDVLCTSGLELISGSSAPTLHVFSLASRASSCECRARQHSRLALQRSAATHDSRDTRRHASRSDAVCGGVLLEQGWPLLVMRSWPEMIRRCLLYTSDAADEEDSVDIGGRRTIKKQKNKV
eukprot:TRINITY_DN7230_c0_g1_i2.p1 TRINITY_DN7230_c0_g1~~TRINITY_DN7230_c0_g1_i2.p1  ORF type:complete len:142 (-),score=16.23 TRINITY_DN7230_c0_g1_i2:76-501(-)